MRKLTVDESNKVAENHNLIYWYIESRGNLDRDYWYDIIALELCRTVMHHEPERGELSTYFKKRCDNLVRKQFTKIKKDYERVKYSTMDDSQMDSLDWSEDNMDTIGVREFIDNSQNSEIIKLRLEGYSQKEIAKELGMSVMAVHRKMKEIRNECKEYFGNDE